MRAFASTAVRLFMQDGVANQLIARHFIYQNNVKCSLDSLGKYLSENITSYGKFIRMVYRKIDLCVRFSICEERWIETFSDLFIIPMSKE